MNLRKYLIFQLVFQVQIFSLFAQENIRLKGTVIDDHGNPLPLANVSISNGAIGSITNQDGKFRLTLLANHYHDSIRISHVGYKTFIESIETFMKRSTSRIRLTEAMADMPEVVVTGKQIPSAEKIISQARKNIKHNYPIKPFKLKTFYRESKQVNGEYVSLHEAAVDVFARNHKPSNKQFTDELLIVNEFRKSYDYFDKKLDGWLDPPTKINPIKGVLLQNGVKYVRHNNVLQRKGYQLDSIISWEGKEHYIITLPPPNSAKLYIDAENYAVKKFENTRDYTQTQTLLDQIHQDSLKCKLQHLRYALEFKEIEGKFYPFFMELSVHASIENLNRHDTIYDRLVTQRLLVTDIQTENIKPPSGKEQTENTIFNNLNLNYDANFWNNYNIIELTPIEEKLLNDLQKSLSLDEQFKDESLHSVPEARAVFNPKELKADFAKYRSVMQDVHTGLYNYLPQDEWNLLMDSLYQTLNKSRSWNELYELIAYSIAQVRNGHTEAQSPEWWLEKKRSVFPLQIKYIEGKVVVEETFDSELSVPRGSEIVSINGLSTEVIRKRVWPILMADGYIQTYKYRLLSLFYAKYLALALHNSDEYLIEYIPPGEKKKTVRHSGLQTSLRSLEGYLMSNDINNHNDHELEINKEEGYAWLDIHNSSTLEDSLEYYFKKIQDSKVQNLIIDLRGYLGLVQDCHPSMLYSYFVDRPFHFFEYLKVKSNDYQVFDEDFTYVPYATSLTEIKEGYFDKLKQTSDGYFLWEDEPCIGLNKPGKYPFTGDVYILVNGLTFSASADFVSKMSQLDNVTIIGEETGGAKEFYVSGFIPRLTLPNSGIKIFVPTWQSHVCCDESGEIGRGVLPDYEVVQTFADFMGNEDTVEKYVLSLMK